jgi:hypothetical protein
MGIRLPDTPTPVLEDEKTEKVYDASCLVMWIVMGFSCFCSSTLIMAILYVIYKLYD